MPLGPACGDQEKEIFLHPHHRHFRQNTAAMVRNVNQTDPADFGNAANAKPAQPFVGPGALDAVTGKSRQVQYSGRIAYSFAFFADAILPRPGAVPCLGCLLRGVVALFGKPVGTLPPVIGPHLSASCANAVVNRRQLTILARGPAVVRKVHGIFMRINLLAVFDAIIVIRVIGEPARVARPHIPFRLPFGDPFSQNLASPAALGDAKGKDTCLKRVGNAGHGANQRVAVRCVRDRAVDDFGYSGLSQQGHAGHGILDIPLQPVKIVGIKLKRKILGHGIIGFDPMCAAAFFIRTKIEPVLFLPEIIGRVHIAQQRQFLARFL